MKIFITTLVLIMTFNIAISQDEELKQKKQSKPFAIGMIDEVQSKVLNENRTINIYLPEGYNPNDTIKYPVIYLLDGSADEDFIHISGLVQFSNFDWVNLIPKSIVVGIANVDRERDFTFTTTINEQKIRFKRSGHSDKFISFIENELQPYIASNYNVNNIRTLIGQSLGGLLATEILLKKPNLFDNFIIISPSLWWDNGSLLNFSFDKFSQNVSQNVNIYIGVGKEGLTPTELPRVMEVDANILADKLNETKNKNLNIFFDYLRDENHTTIMHQAVFNSFKFLNKNHKQK